MYIKFGFYKCNEFHQHVRQMFGLKFLLYYREQSETLDSQQTTQMEQNP